MTEYLPQFPDFIQGYGWYWVRRELFEKGYHILPTFTKTFPDGTMRLVLVKRKWIGWTRETVVHTAILTARDGDVRGVA